MRAEVQAALREAMKSRDAARTSALRMISAAFKDRDILARGQGTQTASDADLVAVLAKMVKQREESAKAFEAGNRPELAAKERDEIAIIRAFMPAQMSEDDIRVEVAKAIAETGAASARDMGKVMALLKERHAGALDFGKASGIAKALLS